MNNKVFYFGLIVFFIGASIAIKKANSFFTDTETKTGNVISVATDFGSAPPSTSPSPSSSTSPSPSPSVSPSPSPSTSPSPSPSSSPTVNHLVINEIYYDPDSAHIATDLDDQHSEWIEIYNPSNITFNLKNWTITDNSSSQTITTNDWNLNPESFVVVAVSESVKGIWNIPTEKFISLNHMFGSLGLSNDGDRLILKNENNNLIDQMNYGDDVAIWNPAVNDVLEGHSLERKTKGVDTDSRDDFDDRTTPTPGN